MSKGRVVLCYSGGLDTSCILVWLLEQGYEVVCFLADVGQEEDFEKVSKKALSLGALKMVIKDLRKEFIEQFCFRAVQCNAIYEGRYLLGTSLARPVIARAVMKAVASEGCDYVSHGCTGKGNDQVRFELAFMTIDPSVKIIAPWRMPEFFNRFQGRADLLAYAATMSIATEASLQKPWSMDENLAHCSYESGQLEDPSMAPPSDLWVMTDDPLKAPNTPDDITIKWAKGLPIELQSGGKTITDSLELFIVLNALGKKHGIGRIDIVETRFLGQLKSRGCYDSPGLTILRSCHLDLEGLVMDGRVRALRDQFVTFNWSELLYQGLYYSPEREFVEAALIHSQERVNGQVTCRLYKGNVIILGRSSPEKLYSETESSMDSLLGFDPVDATGLIRINGIRLKKYGMQKIEEGNGLGK